MSVEGVYVMGDTLVYLSLSLLLCGLSRITALNQSADSAKRPRENRIVQYLENSSVLFKEYMCMEITNKNTKIELMFFTF